ncbi:hypothetical protein HKX48_001069 [Thoreauomyces humboldtii]|nr:hypothetical protein HKX48_001069 [Thoreauomyces humboldtii]
MGLFSSVYIVLIYLVGRYFFKKSRTPKVPLIDKVVVITGCDTGFGHHTTLVLTGLHKAVVYATCLTPAGVKNLERLRDEQPERYGNIRPVQLDVTVNEDVKKFAEKIEADCLLNNAGINLGSWFSWTTVEEFRKVIDVNLMASVYTMKALLPSLLRYVKNNPTGHAPRIINITSVAGRYNQT